MYLSLSLYLSPPNMGDRQLSCDVMVLPVFKSGDCCLICVHSNATT